MSVNKFIHTGLKVVIVSLTTVTLMEILLRIFWNPPFLDKRWQRDDLLWLSKNAVLNRFGYRSPEVNLLKKDKFRIYFLGDSFTYGWYIDKTEDVYPFLLGKLLNSVEIINAANPGYNFNDEIKRLYEESPLFSPDLVVMGVALEDFASSGVSEKHIKSNFVRNLKLYQITWGGLQRKKVSESLINSLDNLFGKESIEYKKLEENFTKLASYQKVNNANIVLVIFPTFNPSNPDVDYPFISYHEDIRKLAINNNITAIDLLDCFKNVSDKKELVLNPNDMHPSINANKLAASCISDEIFKDNYNFKLFKKTGLKEVGLSIGDKLDNNRLIYFINSPGWVYFDEKYTTNTQNIFFTKTDDKKISYLMDFIKTAKPFTHSGWVGAKLEYNYPAESKDIKIPLNIYGFNVVGVYRISAFNRIKGAMQSVDITKENLEITKDDKSMYIKIKDLGNYDLYRLYLDLSVRQFGMEQGETKSGIKTQFLNINLNPKEEEKEVKLEDKVSAEANFYANGDTIGYGWYKEKQIFINLERKENFIKISNPLKLEGEIQLPVSVEDNQIGEKIKVLINN